MDIWLLVSKYKIPTMLISTFNILQTNYTRTSFLLYGTSTDKMLYILSPALKAGHVPQFSLIQSPTGEITFPIGIFVKEECITNINASMKAHVDIEHYLNEYVVPDKVAYIPKKSKVVKILKKINIVGEEDPTVVEVSKK